jgi:peptide/nickel transport system substrate-binding protein
VLAGLLFAAPVAAQKSGGVLKIQHMDTPPSASIHEEATVSAAVPFMSLYNNLVMFDQHAPKNSLETVVPDLATKWDWKDDNRKLVFVLREGVKWHDGQPFTAKDVACTFDLLLGGETKLRRNPRSAWWTNAVKVTADSDTQATFHLKAPQPSLVALLASGYTPIYPCHVPPDQMRRKPVGTGPFKLAEFKMNEGIKLVKNPDYWKKGPALSRRHRVHHHARPLDAHAVLHRRQVRHDLPVRRHGAAAQEHPARRAQGALHHARERRQREPYHQPRVPAVRQSQHPPRAGVDARSQGLHRHPERRRGQGRRHHAAAGRT